MIILMIFLVGKNKDDDHSTIVILMKKQASEYNMYFWSNFGYVPQLHPKKVATSKGNPLISGKSRLVKYHLA